MLILNAVMKFVGRWIVNKVWGNWGYLYFTCFVSKLEDTSRIKMCVHEGPHLTLMHILDIEAHTWHWGTYLTLRAHTWHWGHILDIEAHTWHWGTYVTLRAHTWHWGHILDIEGTSLTLRAHTWHWGTYLTLRAHTRHWGTYSTLRHILSTYHWSLRGLKGQDTLFLMRLKSLFCLTTVPPVSTG